MSLMSFLLLSPLINFFNESEYYTGLGRSLMESTNIIGVLYKYIWK